MSSRSSFQIATLVAFLLHAPLGWCQSESNRPTGQTGADVSQGVDFAHEIVPILKKHCVECHGGGPAKGGFSINTREHFLDASAIDLKDPSESDIILRGVSTEADYRMPPPKPNESEEDR
ncbi:MAG: c-type cytochrome domain-containing protein, partial [Planctomycetota bacterium]